MSDNITVQTEGRVTTLTINRPAKRNALTQDMYAAMADAIAAYGADDTQRAFIITGAADFFTAGNDINDFAAVSFDSSMPVVRFLETLRDCEKPVIAAMNGPGVGVGVTLLLHCDLVIAADTATFSTPFVQLAVVPEAGASVLLPALIGKAMANDMLLAGRILTAQEALAHGLVSRLCAPEDLAEAAQTLARQIADAAPNAMRRSKGLLAAGREELTAQMNREFELFFDQLKSPEFMEVVTAKMQARAPKF